jgi:hypothetical protein
MLGNIYGSPLVDFSSHTDESIDIDVGAAVHWTLLCHEKNLNESFRHHCTIIRLSDGNRASIDSRLKIICVAVPHGNRESYKIHENERQALVQML